MEFSVEFYETASGKCPVKDFLEELKQSDFDDFTAIVAGLAKLGSRQYHRPPLSKALDSGLFELRHVGKLNTRILYFHAGQTDRCRPRHQKQGDENTDKRLRYSHAENAGLADEEPMMKQKTNFDRYLEEQLKDEAFAERFKKAGEAWDVAVQLSALRREAGLSQKELAVRVGTSQQQISRLESPAYEGHSLSMLRRVAEVLGASLRVEFQSGKRSKPLGVAEEQKNYGVKKRKPLPSHA